MFQSRPDNLDFGMGIFFKAFRQDYIDIPDIAIPQFRQFVVSGCIFYNGDLMGGRDDRRLRACFLVPPTVFSFMIDVKTVDIVLDRRYSIASAP